jgi:hypothetical protein
MTDQELLEYAAKAVGFIDYPKDSIEQGGFWHVDKDKAPFGGRISKEDWSPLLSDADAFRLMCDLGIDIESYYLMPHLSLGERVRAKGISHHVESVGPCPRTPVRRAIVRAAAEIGKCLTEEEGTK